jgi:UDP:flavonoid glycosyltransferase YjiC (YdhE family)
MRVLAVCVDSPGHVNPLLPLLTALTGQGDDVVVASGPGSVDLVTAAGLRSQVVGRGFDGWFTDLLARTRGTPGDGLPPDRIEHYFLPRLFAEIGAADMIDGLMSTATSTPPDLVLFEAYAYAAALAAAVLGVPAAGLQIGFQPPREVTAAVADALSPLWRESGFPVDRERAVFGDLRLRTAPASLEPATAPVRTVALRPTRPPAIGPRPQQPPLVHVTAGTAPHRDLKILRCVIEALADEPVQVMVTVGSDAPPDWARDLPANTTVHGYVPYTDLLPRCSAVVHHGGAGTMYAALAHGLPAVITPSGADQFANAARIAAAGAGVVLDASALTADGIRASVHTALRDEAMQARARRMAAEIAAMPDATAVAATLRDLTTEHPDGSALETTA